MAELSNRSLDRGIAVLESLARNGAGSLAALHKDTGLAKSTLRRLLATLIRHRLVRRSVSDGLYRVTITLPAGAGESAPQEMSGLIDVAMPRAAELTRQVEWPSDIHVMDGPCMRIIDSTRPLSPFHMYRGIINRRINIFGSATGVAVLSAHSDEQIREFDAVTRGNMSLGLARFGLTLDRYMGDIEAARERGYGTRLGVYRGETVLDDGLAAIAVPILVHGEPSAAISLLWPRAFQDTAGFAASHLDALNETAGLIAEDLSRLFPPDSGITRSGRPVRRGGSAPGQRR